MGEVEVYGHQWDAHSSGSLCGDLRNIAKLFSESTLLLCSRGLPYIFHGFYFEELRSKIWQGSAHVRNTREIRVLSPLRRLITDIETATAMHSGRRIHLCSFQDFSLFGAKSWNPTKFQLFQLYKFIFMSIQVRSMANSWMDGWIDGWMDRWMDG